MPDRVYTTFNVHSEKHVTVVTFDHPPINLMDRTMTTELRDLLSVLQADRNTKVVVFRSALADFFIAHADLGLFDGKVTTPPPRSSKLHFMHRLFEGYRKLPMATIAVIEGRANGAGTEFALSLDMQFAALGRASLGQFEVALGCLPGGTGTQRLPHLTGRSRALEMILGCDEIDAKTAELYGVINRALPPEELHPFVNAFVARIASFPAKAIALAKESVDHALGDPTQALVEENYLAGQLIVTEEVSRRFAKIMALGAQTPAGERRMSQLLLELEDKQ
jgi:enoyl-CoA hydratase/carnithine racemase